CGFAPGRRRRLQHRGCDLLEVPSGDCPVPVAREDHLALLGDLEMTGHRSWGLGSNGAVGRAAAPAERPTASVKEREADAVPGGALRQSRLSPTERERCREGADLLCRV